MTRTDRAPDIANTEDSPMWNEVAPVPAGAATSPLFGAVARAVLGAVAALILWWLGLRWPAVAVVVATIVLLVLAAVSPSAAARVDRLVRRVTSPIVSAFTFVVMAGLHVLVFTPVALVLRLLRRDPLHADPAQQDTAWVPRPDVPPEDLVSRQYSFDVRSGPATPPSRAGTVAGLAKAGIIALAVVVALDLAGGIAWNTISSLRDSDGPDPRAAQPAFEGDEWAEDYFEELVGAANFRFEPLLGFLREDFSGEYITIVDDIRPSYRPAAPLDRSASVWFFGGSTMWGSGQRDDYTIPSYVARLAEADGIALDAVNYGQSGWVIWQELALLQQLLAAGQVPDVAVFYNGVNDVNLQVQGLESEPSYVRAGQIRTALDDRIDPEGIETTFARWYARYSFVWKVRRELRGSRPPPAPRPAQVEERADNAVRLHDQAVELIQGLADQYGFEARFFWQPVVFTKAAGEEAVLGEPDIDPAGWSDTYLRATTLVTEPVIDLTGVLDGIASPTYYDRVHTNEAGAERIAAEIYRHLGLDR